MPAPQSTTWLTVEKFLGIKQVGEGLISESPEPIGALASEDADGVVVTHSCINLPNGGLGPVPFVFAPIATGPANPDNATRIGNFYWVGGLHVPQVVTYEKATVGTYVADDFASCFVSLNYIHDGGGGPAVPQARRTRVYQFSTSSHVLLELQKPGAAVFPYAESNPVDPFWFDIGGFTPFCSYRSSSPGLVTDPGLILEVIGLSQPGDPNAIVGRYPAIGFGAPRTSAVGGGGGFFGGDCIHLTAHQGRLLANGYHAPQLYNNIGVAHTDDTLWTIPNQDNFDNNGYSAFSQATIGLYGLVLSASANELIVIRANSNGGLTISSDLNDPIITDYPGVQGTNGCHINGVWTPIGLVYAAENGSVHAYVGGGRSQDLAPDMENGFWGVKSVQLGQGFEVDPGVEYPHTNGSIPYIPHRGQLAYHNNLVFVPGCWLYDTLTNTWWRFKTPADNQASVNGEFTHMWFDTSPLGSIYSAPGTYFRQGVVNCLIARAQFQDSAAPNWLATTQPIPIAENSEIGEVREIVVEGIAPNLTTGQAFDVTLTSQPNGEVFTHRFNFTTIEKTEAFRTTVPNKIRGTHVVVSIEASDFSFQNAPTLMRFSLGMGPAVSMVTNG